MYNCSKKFFVIEKKKTKEKKEKVKKLARLTIFYQVNYVKKLTNSDFVNYVFELLMNLYNYRTIVRKIRKEYKKIKSLNKKRCIQLKMKTKSKMLKTLLNSESEINFIS